MEDQVEIILGRADETLKQVETAVRKTTHEAVVLGAGALRRQVDDLRARLKALSESLARLEPSSRPARVRRPSARPAARVRRARPRKAARSKAA